MSFVFLFLFIYFLSCGAGFVCNIISIICILYHIWQTKMKNKSNFANSTKPRHSVIIRLLQTENISIFNQLGFKYIYTLLNYWTIDFGCLKPGKQPTLNEIDNTIVVKKKAKLTFQKFAVHSTSTSAHLIKIFKKHCPVQSQLLLSDPIRALPVSVCYMWPFKRVSVIIKIRGSLSNML